MAIKTERELQVHINYTKFCSSGLRSD